MAAIECQRRWDFLPRYIPTTILISDVDPPPCAMCPTVATHREDESAVAGSRLEKRDRDPGIILPGIHPYKSSVGKCGEIGGAG